LFTSGFAKRRKKDVLIESTRPAGYHGRSQFVADGILPLASSHYCANGASDNNADCGGRYNTGRRAHDNNRVDADSNNRRKTHNRLYAYSSHVRNTLVLWKW
jgi:hypothetical protein